MSDQRHVYNGKPIRGRSYPSWSSPTTPRSQVFLRWTGWGLTVAVFVLAVVLAAVALGK